MLTPEQLDELEQARGVVPLKLAAHAIDYPYNNATIRARAGLELAPGIKAIRVGARKWVVPAAPLRRLLGLDQ